MWQNIKAWFNLHWLTIVEVLGGLALFLGYSDATSTLRTEAALKLTQNKDAKLNAQDDANAAAINNLETQKTAEESTAANSTPAEVEDFYKKRQ